MERWEIFVRALSKRVSLPSEAFPTVRCWKHSTLSGEIKAIVRENGSELLTTFPAACEVIDHLKRMGWARPIKVRSPAGDESLEFLLVDMGLGEGQPVAPLELLEAWLPAGTLCYFSALAHYELTTQVATHHHIARLVPHRLKTEGTAAKEPGAARETAERNPLGTEVFRFEDVPCYETRREASLVPGIQMRVVSPKTWLRITTLEQSLLDALLQPVRCGGEAVVLEAWENGLDEMDADRMTDHLSKIQREDLERRVGAMLDLLGANIAATSLGRRLEQLQARLAVSAQHLPAIPLLPGFQYANLGGVWKVQTP